LAFLYIPVALLEVETKKNIFKTTKSKTPSKSRLTEKQKKALKLLEELKGIGTGIWKEDAQEYVNRLRSNDRF
jgi:hypothetical protein